MSKQGSKNSVVAKNTTQDGAEPTVSIGHGLWNMDCELWIVDCGLWTVDCELWTVDCGRIVDCVDGIDLNRRTHIAIHNCELKNVVAKRRNTE